METAIFSAQRFRNLLRMNWVEQRKFYFRKVVFFYLFATAYMCWYMLPDASHAHTVMQEAGLPGRQAEWQTLSTQIAQGIDGSWKEVKSALVLVLSLFCFICTNNCKLYKLQRMYQTVQTSGSKAVLSGCVRNTRKQI